MDDRRQWVARGGDADDPWGPPPGRRWDLPPAPRDQPPGARPPRRQNVLGRSGSTPLTLVLIAVNVLAYLLQQARPSITYQYGLLPSAVADGQYDRLLTSAFLHAGVLHLASNMLALYLAGAPLERLLGRTRFAVLYFASALGGSLLAVALSPPDTLGVGASGAVFGLFGALVVVGRRVGAELSGVATLIGINLVISFAVPGISWQAHIGGLVTGVLVAAVLAPTLRRSRGHGRPG